MMTISRFCLLVTMAFMSTISVSTTCSESGLRLGRKIVEFTYSSLLPKLYSQLDRVFRLWDRTKLLCSSYTPVFRSNVYSAASYVTKRSLVSAALVGGAIAGGYCAWNWYVAYKKRKIRPEEIAESYYEDIE